MSKNVLFIPGLLCDARLFSAQTAYLEKNGFHCAVADIAGFDSIPLLAQAVVRAHFTPGMQWNVVALSMGGYVAFELLATIYDRIARIALFNTSARADTAEQIETRQGLIALSQKGEFQGVTSRLLPRLLYSKNLDNKPITDLIRAMAKDIGQQGFTRQQTAIMGRVDRREFLQQIHKPALVIGGEHDVITPPEIIQEINQLIPGSTCHILPQAGHLTVLEQPETCNGFLLQFLQNASPNG